MRILLNAAPLATVLTGVQRYTRALYEAILTEELATVDFYHHGRVTRQMPLQPEGSPRQLIPPPLRYVLREAKLVLEDMYLSRSLERLEIDVYHETGHFPVANSSSVPTVLTIYDLSPILHPEFHPPDRIRYFEKHFYDRIERAAHIITISEFVRGEIVSVLGVDPSRVSAVPLAAEATFRPRPPADVQAYLDGSGIPRGYLLCVGVQEPRKNLVTVLEAMARMKQPPVLVCAGWIGWLGGEFNAALDRYRLRDRVRQLGHVSDEELALLYSGAAAMVYPSLYEGFGLPVLEAMACGCPVVCSNRASLPEVAGNAAMFVDPADTESLASALCRVLQDELVRRRLVARGKEHVKGFSWVATARETVRVLDSVRNAGAGARDAVVSR